MSNSQASAFRGEIVDVGGRGLRMVRAGPEDAQPLIVLEHGAFGCASDWAVVQERLAAKGLRSLAYDRAGLGHSDPGPEPRDGRALVADLRAALEAVDQRTPILLVGHSMAGLLVRLYALTYPAEVRGVVLVDAVTPSISQSPAGLKFVRNYGRAMRLVGLGARAGLMRAVALLSGNLIGLTGAAAMEKRRIYGSASHAHWSAREVSQWPATAQQAIADIPPNLPVAVVTAGAEKRLEWLKALQVEPARASRHGYVEHVAGAAHASLLGQRFADRVVAGVEHVLKAADR